MKSIFHENQNISEDAIILLLYTLYMLAKQIVRFGLVFRDTSFRWKIVSKRVGTKSVNDSVYTDISGYF